MIALQAISLSKYAVFFILVLSFRGWAQKYYLSVAAGIRQSILLSAMRLALILLLVLVLVRVPLQALIAYVFQIKKIKAVGVSSFVEKVLSKLPAVIVLIYLIIFAELQRRSFREGLALNRQTYYLALLFTLAVILFMRTLSLLSHICNHLFNRFRSHRCADSVIVVHLLSLVELVRISKDFLSDSRRRRTAIGLLEDVALRFEVSLPKQIVGTDLSSLPLQRDLAKIGGGIRALKQRVAIPTSNMWDEKLRRDLSQFLINFLSLNWAALPTDETQLRSSVTLISKVKAFIRSIMTGAIPAILLAIVQVSPFRLTRQRAEVALLVAAAWFAVSVLLRLDPEFAAKTQALKDVQQIVAPSIKP